MLNVKVSLKYYPYLGLMSSLTLCDDRPINSNTFSLFVYSWTVSSSKRAKADAVGGESPMSSYRW